MNLLTESEHEPFLAAIYEDPENRDAYSVYADWLAERGDPRGEFIQLQWQLEDESFTGEARQAAQEKEAAHLQANQESWLGDLAPDLCGHKPLFPPSHYGSEGDYQFGFGRGFLDMLTVNFLVPKFAEKLRQSDCRHLLRNLTIAYLPNGDQLVEDFEEYADRNWTWDDNPSLDALIGGEFLNLRRLQVGEDVMLYAGGKIHHLLQGTPRLEGLSLSVNGVNMDALFAMKLRQLKSIQVDHLTHYPMELLAANPSLTNLESISFTPHMLEAGDDPYLDLAGIRAVCRSPHLQNLKFIHLQCTDFGDEGIGEIVNSGLLGRLESLRLPYGATTDEGARLIMAAKLGNLKHLDLSGHYLSDACCQALKELNLSVKCGDQHSGDPRAGEMEHLWYGDME